MDCTHQRIYRRLHILELAQIHEITFHYGCLFNPLVTVANTYYTRLWASFFVKLWEKIPGGGLLFFGLI